MSIGGQKIPPLENASTNFATGNDSDGHCFCCRSLEFGKGDGNQLREWMPSPDLVYLSPDQAAIKRELLEIEQPIIETPLFGLVGTG